MATHNTSKRTHCPARFVTEPARLNPTIQLPVQVIVVQVASGFDSWRIGGSVILGAG